MNTSKVEANITPIKPEKTFQIKAATKDDMQIVTEFISSSADMYRPFVHEDDMSEHEPDQEWADKNMFKRDFFLAYDQKIPVGCISLQYFDDYAYTGYIYLDVEHTGKGLGKKLLEFAEAKAERKGMKGIVLLAHPEAEWATKAYEKFGFKKIAETKEEVLDWKGGVIKEYYEEGFHLYLYSFDD